MGLFDWFKKKEESFYESERRQEKDDCPENCSGDCTAEEAAARAAQAARQVRGGDGFRLVVQDTFSITGRGTVVTGVVDAGSVSVGDWVFLNKKDGRVLRMKVGGIESFRKMLPSAGPGMKVGLLLRDVTKYEVQPGEVLTN